jgi:cellulose synthase/poly-beta-1,6-N-acetylglucosamine synthase-like glycosyltransferase
MQTISPSREGVSRPFDLKKAAEPGKAGVDFRRELHITGVSIALTVAMTAAALWGLGANLSGFAASGDVPGIAGHLVFVAIVGFLLYGSFVYQLTRLGYLRRRAEHRPASGDELAQVYRQNPGELAVLVPSYKEEIAVVTRTLMSAALQDHPRRRVVLLIDDPPQPREAADREALEAARALPVQLQRLFDQAAAPFDAAQREFLRRSAFGRIDVGVEGKNLGRLHRRAARWCDGQVAALDQGDSAEQLYADLVLRRCRDAHLQRAEEIEALGRTRQLLAEQIGAEYQRLARRFHVELSSFERKRYVNLSHEPNKAMNLNSYIGLMGARLREVERDDGLHLVPVGEGPSDWTNTDAEFLVTLDADSLIAPDYALRLIHLMREPGNERIAVAQTPYSSIPAEPGSLEYVAGATTDIQYLIHQGFTRFGATYWVGANALLRKSALEDIAETQIERGFPVRLFIQDRTVIEDTESSVDLVDKGWQLHNYPERLAYSATPPDFGSLLIQRRRWANGGLIILPKLLRHLLRNPFRRGKLAEGFFRIHYLSSIAAVNVGLLITLAMPFESSVEGLWWLPLTAIPYFFLYTRDLTQIGYRASDMLRVYALNLLLIPINLGGVAKSVEQAITRKKIPFGRTPKVLGRTAAPAFYVLAEYALVVWWLVGSAFSLAEAHWGHAAFAFANTAFLVYAIGRYIGLRESVEDVAAALPKRPQAEPAPIAEAQPAYAPEGQAEIYSSARTVAG